MSEANPSPFACDLEEFKRVVAKFINHAANFDITFDALSQAHKLVGLSYLNLIVKERSDIPIAVSYLEFANKRFIDREVEFNIKGEI